MSRRPFFLMEILMALALISMCAIPLIRPHFILAKKDIEAARIIQQEMAANAQFEIIREKLYTGEIPWRTQGTYTTDNYTIAAPSQRHKGRGINRRTYRLYKITIVQNNIEYHYKLFAEKVKSTTPS